MGNEKRQKIGIFGAGELGKHVYLKLSKDGSKEICVFIDNDPNKKGSRHCGIKVCHFDELQALNLDYIYIASEAWPQIRQQLNSNGIYNYRIPKLEQGFSIRYKQLCRKLKALQAENTTLVLQPGKVGSQAITQALKKRQIAHINLHTLGPAIVANVEQQWMLQSPKSTLMDHLFNFSSRAILKHQVTKRRSSLKVITGIREPVSRAISLSFQSLHFMLGERYEFSQTTNEAFLDCFNNLFFAYLNHSYIDEWFDSELSFLIGEDLLQQNVDKQKQYFLMNTQLAEIFLYKHEYLTELESPLSRFLGVDKITLERQNSANAKWYSLLNDYIKHEFKIEPQYLQKLASLKYVKSFYSDQEVERLFARWERH